MTGGKRECLFLKVLSVIINRTAVFFYFDMFCALVVSVVDLAFPQILNFFDGRPVCAKCRRDHPQPVDCCGGPDCNVCDPVWLPVFYHDMGPCDGRAHGERYASGPV